MSLRRAAETARVLGEGGVEADARATLAYDRAVFGDELALAEVYEASALALASDAGEAVTKLYVNLANTLLFMGRFEQLAQVSRDGADAAERYGLLGLHGILVLGKRAAGAGTARPDGTRQRRTASTTSTVDTAPRAFTSGPRRSSDGRRSKDSVGTTRRRRRSVGVGSSCSRRATTRVTSPNSAPC